MQKLKGVRYLDLNIWIILAIWLVIAAVALVVQISSEINQQRDNFEKQSQTIFQLIQQRIDQNETVISGLDALFNTFPNLKFDDIRSYAREMLALYPHIYTIELQPRVELSKVSNFENIISAKLNFPYTIKDFEFGGARHWHPAPARPFYYPITFMEPPIEKASPVFGLDVYADSKFHEAMAKTISTGKAATSLPFDLVENGRGYLIFEAIFSATKPVSKNKPIIKQVKQVVSILIDADKFLSKEDMPYKNLSIHLYNREFNRNNANGNIIRVESSSTPTFFAGLLPVFTFSRPIKSKSQPFEFETQRKLGWEIIHIPSTIFVLLASLTITALIVIIINQRRIARESVNSAANLLLIEKERSLIRETFEKQRRQHEAELAHVARLSTMGEMASGIAHELNQPLTAILSYNQACIRMFQEDQVDKDKILQAMKSSAAQSKRASQIIQQLRNFVSKKGNPLQTIELNQIVLDVLILVENELREQQIKVKTDLDKSNSLVTANRVQLEQVVLNLVLNAMEAMKDTLAEHKQLFIVTLVDNNVISLSIQDHGQGIPAENIDQLFNPFFTTKSNGMGLGLTISQTIIEAYGGRISAKNYSDGSIFMFTLPIATV